MAEVPFAGFCTPKDVLGDLSRDGYLGEPVITWIYIAKSVILKVFWVLRFGLFFKAINYTQWYQWTSALFDGGEVYPWRGKFELKNHFETLYL